ncbi:hypothetical protein HanRHA438_Chr03g0111261 [Helianthus annuus]|nr:hypothetical protein HanIR_Chr03g0109391 [Helianthus annuus]KAJ0934761.1 hypothetical protein HanRHA438_Chr03g0111261 [Helianthus annuus]
MNLVVDCYYIPDFRRAQTSVMRALRGAKETFNYYCSSLRNIIERTFGVWKARQALLRDMHVNFTYDHQVSIVIASMVIHYFIRKVGGFDKAFDRAQQESYSPRGGGTSDKFTKKFRLHVDDDMHMAAIRDIIEEDIMTLRR